MSNYSMSDCLTFGLVLLFLLGALVAGPAITMPAMTMPHMPKHNLQVMPGNKGDKEGVIEQFTSPGKVLGQVNPDMIRLYNS